MTKHLYPVGNDFNQEAIESFLAEGVIMKDFNHPHILRLLGMSIDERGNPMVILPYMANGDLRSYVKDKTRVRSHDIQLLSDWSE